MNYPVGSIFAQENKALIPSNNQQEKTRVKSNENMQQGTSVSRMAHAKRSSSLCFAPLHLAPIFLCGKGMFLFSIEHLTIDHHLISMHVNILNTVQANM